MRQIRNPLRPRFAEKLNICDTAASFARRARWSPMPVSRHGRHPLLAASRRDERRPARITFAMTHPIVSVRAKQRKYSAYIEELIAAGIDSGELRPTSARLTDFAL